MAVINETTAHLALQLPHPSNSLEDDILRLRSAISAIDTKFQGLDTLLSSDDATLDQVQELVNAIKANAGDILDLLSDKADAVDLTQQEEVQTLADAQTVVNLLQLTTTAGCQVYVEGVRLNKNEWTKDATVLTRFTLSTAYPAGHSIAVVRQQGGV
jgi:hypothetical protein